MAYFGDPVVDATMFEADYISQFEEWNNRLNEELGYMLTQPLDEELLCKIGEIVQQFFADPMFHHNNHEVHVIRLPDGGVSVTVAMDYENPEDYMEDFDLAAEEDVAIHMIVDDISDIDDDEFSVGVLFDYDPDPEIMHMAEAAYRAAVAHAELVQAQQEIVDILAARAATVEAQTPLAAVTGQEETWHHVVPSGGRTMAAEDTDEKKPQSPDDILFAPIPPQDEKKKPESPKPADDFCYDCDD